MKRFYLMPFLARLLLEVDISADR